MSKYNMCDLIIVDQISDEIKKNPKQGFLGLSLLRASRYLGGRDGLDQGRIDYKFLFFAIPFVHQI